MGYAVRVKHIQTIKRRGRVPIRYAPSPYHPFSSFLVFYEINFTAVQTYSQHRAILCGKLRVPSFQGGVYGKTDVNISLETILDGSLTLLVLGENQKLKNTSTCKNLYR